MGAREDFNQALQRGDFAAAARAWATDGLDWGPGVEAFESKLAASLDDRHYVLGDSLTVDGGEYAYLGKSGKDGASLAYLPNDGSLDAITYLRDHDELLAHLERIGAAAPDRDAVIAFYAMSERQANEQSQQAAHRAVSQETAANPAPAVENGAGPDQTAAPDAVELPAPVADFRKRLQNATWFFDTNGDETERETGQQSLAQLREDFKALMIEYPAEAAEVWRAEAPTEYQPELSDLQAQLENAAPEVIKAHEDHDRAEELQQEGAAEHQGQDPIIAASPGAAREEEDLIQPVLLETSGEKTERAVDAISRFGAAKVDAIANAGSNKKVEQANAQAQLDPTAGGPRTLLNGRFVLRDNGEYFRVADGAESERVALVDEASKIRFVDKQMDTFQAAIELAKHKQWEAILVTGSEKFRAEAWHHARMAGLEVVGYEPTEKDMAALKAAQEGRVVEQPANPVDTETAKSLKAAFDHAIGEGYGVTEPKAPNSRHIGEIIHETDKHIVQDVGRKVAVVHDKESFDQHALRTAMEARTPLKIQYEKGRAVIEGGKERAQERGR